MADQDAPESETAASWLKRFTAWARFGDAGQRSLIVDALIAISRILSDGRMHAHPDGAKVRQHVPVRILGPGVIRIRGLVIFGVPGNASFHEGVLLAARTPESRIEIDEVTTIGNGSSIISEGASITIGKRVLGGANLFCADSNFHDLTPGKRFQLDPKPLPVVIEDDVFIGEGVKILKGAHIGAGSVIAAGAVLLPRFKCPPGSTVVGNPAFVRERETTPGPETP